MTDAPAPKRRGRPPGSKNSNANGAAKPVAPASSTATASQTTSATPPPAPLEWRDVAAESDKIPIETSNGTEMLPCKLTEPELHSKGREAGALNAEIASLETKKKAAQTHYKSKINMAMEARDKAIDCLSRGAEDRLVGTVEQKVFATNTVRVVRTDTQEVIRERAMYASEMQRKLPLKETAAATAPLPTTPPAPTSTIQDPALEEMESNFDYDPDPDFGDGGLEE